MMTAIDPYAGERLKKSPFYPRQKALNIRNAWGAWNGYKFADHYYDSEYEYFCIRNTCGTYDICPMQKYEIKGRDAEVMLNRMVTRDVAKIGLNRVAYCVWCTDAGRMIDDGTIFKLADDRFMLTCGSPCTAWLEKAAFGFDDISVSDVTDKIAGLALQGPTSCATLKSMGLGDIDQARPFDIRHFPFHGETLMVSRTGFTGDLGYELWIAADLALELWDELYAAGENHGIQPFGEAATNMARLEAAFIMPAMEFNEALRTVHFEHDQTPFELNLGWLVDFDKPHFSGREALLKEKQRGPKYTLTKLDIEGNKPADGSYIYQNKRCTREIGYITSAMWSPTVKANIALAMIKTEYLKGDLWAEIYYEKELRQYSRVARCTRQTQPFWKPSRARATPPPDR
jgi:aminomethyltransferase